MRGAGKTTLSGAAAKSLNLCVVDVDQELEKVYFSECIQSHVHTVLLTPSPLPRTHTQSIGTDIKSLIASKGWAAFRRAETRAFKKALRDHPNGAVIACGGGIVVTHENRVALEAHPRVIEIVRHIDDIVSYLDLDKTRPAYAAASTRETYATRVPWFDECAGYQFVIERGENDWSSVEQDFASLVRLVQAGRLSQRKTKLSR